MTVTITVTTNGPFVIDAGDNALSLTDVRGQTRVITGAESVALCRCGQSGNKPYCDGTHSTIGFTDGE